MKYWQNRQWLEHEYIFNNRTTQDIGKEVDANSGSVYYWIKKVGLSPRKNYDINKARFDLLQNYDWMYKQYVTLKRSLKDIASCTGVSCLTVRRNLALQSIPINPVGVILSDIVYIRPKGSCSPTWKGGKPKCVDCEATLGGRYRGSNHRCLSCKSKFYRGNRHPSWKPNKSPQAYSNAARCSAAYKDWRKAVFQRDNYTCQICKVRGGNLHAHHLNGFTNFPNLRYDLNNGITLCVEHHTEFHRQHGLGGNTVEQFYQYTANAVPFTIAA